MRWPEERAHEIASRRIGIALALAAIPWACNVGAQTEQEEGQVSTGFFDEQSGQAIDAARDTLPIEDAPAPPPSGRAEPDPGAITRPFLNDRMNSRALFALDAKGLEELSRVALDPLFGPRHVLLSGERLAVVGGGPILLLERDLTVAGKITGIAEEPVLHAGDGLVYSTYPEGELAAFHLDDGRAAYTATLSFGWDYARPWFTRRDGRVLLLGIEEMVDPGAERMPEFVTVEVLDLGHPVVAGLGDVLTSSTEVAARKRKGEQILAAAHGERVVVGVEDHLILFDWDLHAHGDFHGEFTPVRLSLDEEGTMHVCVEERGADPGPSLWVVQPDGRRTLRLRLEWPCERLLAPPVIGYDHTIHLVTAKSVVAVDGGGEVKWVRPARASFAGAVALPDGRLLVADGAELAAFDAEGTRSALFEADAPLATPPLPIDAGRVAVATETALILLGPGR